jgi:hypothetical protein
MDRSIHVEERAGKSAAGKLASGIDGLPLGVTAREGRSTKWTPLI